MTRRHGDLISSPRVAASPRHRVASSLITLLTDFGTADYFVAAMKGVILSIAPNARIVDITHETPAQDIEAAAFTLLAGYSSFPPGTIHVAVVDPGVGSSRKPILVVAGEHFFVGPDNGIFSYICDHERDQQTFHLTNEKYFLSPVSATFQGRDIFAPVAAALATGVKPDELGTSARKIVRLKSLKPEKLGNGKIKARIIHTDRFGNCITNLTQIDLTSEAIKAGAQLRVNGKKIGSFKQFFSEEGREKLFAIWGSAGFLEIAATNKSAAKILKAQRGQAVTVLRKQDSGAQASARKVKK